MEVRAWLLCLLLPGTVAQGSLSSGASFLSQEGELFLSENPLPPEKTSETSSHNPDVYLIRSKPSAHVRPYSLSLAPDDYHYTPKPKHLRGPRLLKLLGSSYDPFWMSPEDPRGRNTSLEELGTLSQDLADGTSRYRRKLLRAAEDLEFPLLPVSEEGLPGNLSQAITHHLRQWLVDSATCHLTSSWVDLGPVFWPRWVRRTECDASHTRCSWPPGMTCRPAQFTHIKLLVWHCWASRDPGMSTSRVIQQCTWRQIPYPVVAACKCSCR
ncbi:PREDICTED: noggin-like [Crocodylus porosus]|uniref:Noggin-like n=1 Tax=Crocodylus porosus TaxID=8502 RepID=A0A7M4FQA4_CROPO|nr:PREDICTED: noggin-like [Crocodylus porosus]